MTDLVIDTEHKVKNTPGRKPDPPALNSVWKTTDHDYIATKCAPEPEDINPHHDNLKMKLDWVIRRLDQIERVHLSEKEISKLWKNLYKP